LSLFNVWLVIIYDLLCSSRHEINASEFPLNQKQILLPIIATDYI